MVEDDVITLVLIGVLCQAKHDVLFALNQLLFIQY